LGDPRPRPPGADREAVLDPDRDGVSDLELPHGAARPRPRPRLSRRLRLALLWNRALPAPDDHAGAGHGRPRPGRPRGQRVLQARGAGPQQRPARGARGAPRARAGTRGGDPRGGAADARPRGAPSARPRLMRPPLVGAAALFVSGMAATSYGQASVVDRP